MTTADLQQWQQSLGARVTLQADLTWAGGQDGYVAAGGQDGASPFQSLWWILEPIAEHCPDCLMLAANSPYDPPWSTSPSANILQTTPGAGATECGAGCKCSLDYGPTGEQVASWGNWLPQGTPMPEEYISADVNELIPPTPPTRAGSVSSGQGYSPYGKLPANGGFTDEQKAALDLYRLAELQWNDVRGDLPELPNFFMLDSVRFSRYAVGYDQLTPKQQAAIDLALEAFFHWENSAPDDWMGGDS